MPTGIYENKYGAKVSQGETERPLTNGNATMDYKAEYKRLREENIKLSLENHYLKSAAIALNIKFFGGESNERQ